MKTEINGSSVDSYTLSVAGNCADEQDRQLTNSRRSMIRALKQLWLLMQKNFIIVKRAIAWTLFEMVLPMALLLPITLFFSINTSKSGKTMEPVHFFRSWPITGEAGEIYRSSCVLKIAYCGNSAGLDNFMQLFASRYGRLTNRTEVQRFANRDQMLMKLKNNSVDYRDCSEYVSGVMFNTYNKSRLDYQILMPTGKSHYEDWKLSTSWVDRSCGHDISDRPMYWTSGFLSIQHALDSIFIQSDDLRSTANNQSFPVELEGIPENSCIKNPLSDLLRYLPIMLALFLFCTVLHSGREVAQEKQAVKAFLSVMGLQTSMFYLSHILFSWMKCTLVLSVCAIPLALVIKEINTVIFLITFLLYGLGVVSFAILCSSPFKSPNTALKVTIVMWIVSAGCGSFNVPSLDDMFFCFLASFNINHAFQLAFNVMVEFMQRDEYLGFSSLFANGSVRFTIGHCILMMILDVFLMLVLTIFIDNCLENSDWSLRSIFHRESRTLDAVNNADPVGVHEADNGLEGTVPDIEVEGVIKVWSSTGERAVNGLNLKAYRGQVTVLLGHNGAGKSTTFAMLTGLVKPTSGKIMLCQKDASNGGYHDNVGYCPQGNALFDLLTVDEHLWFIHGLKGVGGDYFIEGDQLMSDLQLLPKLYDLSKNLSGGMKRKLCFCMALIGGSRVILLDEPTAGMDPGARHDVEQLMAKIKGDRTFLLTTHYMDEAERLGDRVFIMANGHVVCSGSTNYLKAIVGSGYVLTIVTRDNVDAITLAARILEMVQVHVKEATIGDLHAKQLEIKLPKDEQHRFSDLFAQLEQRQDDLGITGFGLSLNSLEQVFLKVGEEMDKKNGTNARMESTARDELIESQKSDRYTGLALVLSHLVAVYYKRLLYSIRSWSQLIAQIVVPLSILILVAWVSKIRTEDLDTELSLSIQQFGPTRVIYQDNANDSSVADVYPYFITSVPNNELVNLTARQNTQSVVNPRNSSAPGFGALFRGSKITVLYNVRALHSLPVSLNAVNNARLKAVRPTGSISTSILSYYTFEAIAATETKNIETDKNLQIFLAALMIVLLSLVTSNTAMFLVSERTSKFVQQQALTGVSPIVFWVGSFLYDLTIFVISCTAFLVVFMVAEWQKDFIVYLAGLWMLYFLSSIPFIYIVSLIFSSPSKANVLLAVFQIIVPLMATLAIYLFSLILPIHEFGRVTNVIETVLLFFLPSFCLFHGMMTIASLPIGTAYLEKNVWNKFIYVMHWDKLGKPITCMCVFTVVATVTFVAFQFKFVQRAYYKLWDYGYRKMDDADLVVDEDDDVRRERTRVEISCEINDCSMVVKGLTKQFDDICALDNLTLAVKPRECFGILGVNGAGKTTTFDILTGRTFPTFGSATLDGRDVADQIAIGYCPQFDAVMLDFTGREILEMLARLHGFMQFKEKADIILRAVGMEDQGKKLMKYYSGGQRRKVSVGIALLAVTKMIILDEPTAGIDPKARRHIWSILTAVRDKSDSAQLLTSHSMDECEALCSRIAVLNRGRMIAIGTSQWLKSKFGNNFTLTVVAASVKTREHTISAIGNNFPGAVLKSDAGSNSLTLKWQIARTKNAGLVTDSWSKMFGHCQKLSTDLEATDFCLSQSSLEDTFLSLSKVTPSPQ